MKRRATGPHNNTPGGMSDTDAGNQQAADAPVDSENARSRVQRRRNALKTISGGSVLAAGGLMPNEWARPVIQTVLLPAHAQTSLIDVTTTPIPSTTPEGPPSTTQGCACDGLTITETSVNKTGRTSATVSASGTISSPNNCLVGFSVQVLFEGYTGNNCDAGGGTLVAATSVFALVTSGGNWDTGNVDLTGPSGNLQSVDITAAFPLLETPECSDSVCVDATP